MFVFVVVTFVVACGSEEHAPGAQAQQQDAGEETTEEDCDDDQYWHPLAEECRDEDDGSDAQDCDEDEELDPDTGECVSKCGVNESWDPDAGECVQLDDECGEFEEWDDEQGVCVPTGECGPGDIVGQSCRPDGGVLPGAQVAVEGVNCDNQEFSETVQADDQGYYEFEDIPAGNHELIISSGSWEHTDNVIVHKGEETDLTSEAAKICVESTDVDIAVIEGSFDSIGPLLDEMDIPFNEYSSGGLFSSGEVDDLVSDYDALTEYDIIFAECEADLGGSGFDTDDSVLEANVRAFVEEEGKSLYASDWADEWIEQTLPEALDFRGRDGDSQDVVADVTSSTMQDLVGSNQSEIIFDLGGWSVIEEAGPASIVHFEADVEINGTILEDNPLMVQYNDPIGGGRALFTSFHNTSQPTDDMEEILEHMIFQL